jgi:site-specific DNA-methyltransferase (adenine-specific)
MNLPKPYYQDETVTIYHGDCLEILPQLSTVDVIYTDPVWPGAAPRQPLPGQERATELFARAAAHFPTLAGRLIVHLGCDTAPRFLQGVPPDLPFLRVCWLRRIPPSYKGPVLYGADVAYIFGKGWLPHPETGQRVLSGEYTSVSKGHRDRGNSHPCPRPLSAVEWLVANYTRPGQTILDPFFGSGTLAVACRRLGRRCIGIDVKAAYLDIAVKRLQAAQPALVGVSACE